jgi:hypothetical protein
VVNYLFWNFIVEAEVLLKVFKQVLRQVLGQWVLEKEQVLKEQPYLLQLEIALCQVSNSLEPVAQLSIPSPTLPIAISSTAALLLIFHLLATMPVLGLCQQEINIRSQLTTPGT